MEKHPGYYPSAYHVQASRAYPERHCKSVRVIGIFGFPKLVNWGIWIALLLFQDKLALNITTEQGKTLKDAQGDVFRGLG